MNDHREGTATSGAGGVSSPITVVTSGGLNITLVGTRRSSSSWTVYSSSSRPQQPFSSPASRMGQAIQSANIVPADFSRQHCWPAFRRRAATAELRRFRFLQVQPGGSPSLLSAYACLESGVIGPASALTTVRSSSAARPGC